MLEVLDQILVTAELDVEDEGLAFQALDAFREGPADFSDYLLALSNRAAGCGTTYSFDPRLCAHRAALRWSAPEDGGRTQHPKAEVDATVAWAVPAADGRARAARSLTQDPPRSTRRS